MRIWRVRAAGLIAACALSPWANAQDEERGRLLYETHCGTCHYERVHQRKQSTVKNIAELRDMVARWAPQTRHRFTLDEMEAVAQHLNRSHYRFDVRTNR